MSEINTVEGSRIAVDTDGNTWVPAEDLSTAVRAAVTQVRTIHMAAWEKRERAWIEDHKQLDARIDGLKNELWQAKADAARNARAEEGMREYEQTIGDQQRTIKDLEKALALVKEQRDEYARTARALKPVRRKAL